jgi:hypothetical protein
MKNTADVTGGKPIAVILQSISGVSAINPLVAFDDIHGGKREVLYFYFVPNTTRYIHSVGNLFSIFSFIPDMGYNFDSEPRISKYLFTSVLPRRC